MRVLIQRVTRASVSVQSQIISEIGRGLVLLVGIARGDTATEVDYLAEKCASLRVFDDTHKKMNLSTLDINGELLVVSQFTLYADCRKGRRPSFDQTARPEQAKPLYERFIKQLKGRALRVETGRFGAMMTVEIWNDGPVTFLLERSPEQRAREAL